jgi:glucose/arabinose dehydrogenase
MREPGSSSRTDILYASSDEDVYRYKLGANGDVTNPDAPEKIITGLFRKGNHHSSKSLALDNAGNIYVNIGAPSNICKDEANSPHRILVHCLKNQAVSGNSKQIN